MARYDDICDVPGVLVGHDTLLDAGTGCTVILCGQPMVGSADVRGGAPATRETDLLAPACMMREVHAVVLSGGSAFGLEAASGVARALEERGVGYDVGVARVPIVPAASLFDLGIGDPRIRPDADSGRRALLQARGGPVAQGNVGAGTGATVGKMAGPQWMVKGGLGSASESLPDGEVVGALVAVNALGDLYDPTTGQIVAGARSPDGKGWLADIPRQNVPAPSSPSLNPGVNTTLAVVATNVPLAKADLARIAYMAHDGFAQVIRPTHTPLDGDVVFALSTTAGGADPIRTPVELTHIGAAATRAVARAIVRAVTEATTLGGTPAIRDLPFAAPTARNTPRPPRASE